MKSPIPRIRSISFRLAIATLLVSLLVSVLLTGVQLRLVYHQQVDNATQQLDEIGRSIVPSLSASLWLVDSDRVDLLLDGLIKYPGVAYVKLDSEGRQRTRGKPVTVPALRRSYPLAYDRTGRFPLGQLYIAVDKDFITSRLWRESLRIGLPTLAGLGTASLMLLLLFQGWVTRHLEHMASYARNISIDQLDKPLTLERPFRKWPDEIDQMAVAFNQLRQRMVEDMAKRDRQEHELIAYREHLESLVRLRTMTLQEQALQLESQKLEMQRLAHTDSLTGLSNRREFMERLEDFIFRCRSNGHPLSVLMLDIDHFKAINDNYGHAIGDRALVALAEVCEIQLRDDDAIGRLGGEEFGIALPGSDGEVALAVAERLRKAIAALRVPNASGEMLQFTASIGICALSGPEDSASTLLAHADRALYQAKRGGRNRVVIDRDEDA